LGSASSPSGPNSSSKLVSIGAATPRPPAQLGGAAGLFISAPPPLPPPPPLQRHHRAAAGGCAPPPEPPRPASLPGLGFPVAAWSTAVSLPHSNRANEAGAAAAPAPAPAPGSGGVSPPPASASASWAPPAVSPVAAWGFEGDNDDHLALSPSNSANGSGRATPLRRASGPRPEGSRGLAPLRRRSDPSRTSFDGDAMAAAAATPHIGDGPTPRRARFTPRDPTAGRPGAPTPYSGGLAPLRRQFDMACSLTGANKRSHGSPPGRSTRGESGGGDMHVDEL